MFPSLNAASQLPSGLLLGAIIRLTSLLNPKLKMSRVDHKFCENRDHLYFLHCCILSGKTFNKYLQNKWINGSERREHHEFGITQDRMTTETVSFSSSLLTGGKEAGKKIR